MTSELCTEHTTVTGNLHCLVWALPSSAVWVNFTVSLATAIITTNLLTGVAALLPRPETSKSKCEG